MSVLTIYQKRELLRRQRNLRRFLMGTLVLLCSLFIGALSGNNWVKQSAQPYMYNDISHLPANEVGLLLGTTKWIGTGVKNEYFVNRVEAAAMLIHNGKLKHLIVSGDSSRYYNEPREMLDALLALGVSSTDITLDYAGYRTYDSILRCLRKYDQRKITIISQASHNYRAVFIARANGMNAVAYNAEAPEGAASNPNYREFWARLGAIIDVYIFRTKPRNMGEKVDVGI